MDQREYLRRIYDEGMDAMHRGEAGYETAIRVFTEVIEINPDFMDTLEMRAFCYRQTGRRDLALRDYDEMYRLQQHNTRALRLKGETQLETGDFEAAVACFTEVIENDSFDIYAREGRGKAYRALGRFDEAVSDEALVEDYNRKEQAKWDDPDHYYHYK